MIDKDSYSEEFIVKEQDCISEINSELPSVLGTYTLVKWMEIVSAKLINTQIDTSYYISVGKTVNLEHNGMVKLGEKISIISHIVEQNKKEVQFEIQASYKDNEIANAKHLRVIIPTKLVERMLK